MNPAAEGTRKQQEDGQQQQEEEELDNTILQVTLHPSSFVRIHKMSFPELCKSFRFLFSFLGKWGFGLLSSSLLSVSVCPGSTSFHVGKVQVLFSFIATASCLAIIKRGIRANPMS